MFKSTNPRITRRISSRKPILGLGRISSGVFSFTPLSSFSSPSRNLERENQLTRAILGIFLSSLPVSPTGLCARSTDTNRVCPFFGALLVKLWLPKLHQCLDFNGFHPVQGKAPDGIASSLDYTITHPSSIICFFLSIPLLPHFGSSNYLHNISLP